MKTSDIKKMLKEESIKKKILDLGISHLDLVGSYATGAETTGSDVDLLYKKKKKIQKTFLY